jgi:hypothetical protein
MDRTLFREKRGDPAPYNAIVFAPTMLSIATSNLREMPAMLIREHPAKISDGDITYIVRIYGEERIDRTWEAWLEFHPTDLTQPILRTDQETSQPNRVAIEYWADGLEPIYLEGALARAQGRLL